MCGIFGIVNSDKTKIDSILFRESAQLMNHRGPNAYGQWGIENKIELGHLRLSIIDLNPTSNQPFFSDSTKHVIVFNGEIYNYIELRAELENLGYSFRTQSDTEVLLNSYIEWGEECVNKFNGDWSFAIYDIENEKIFCSRDRFGVKPFNYAIVDNNFIFSSEIKSIINYYSSLKVPNLKTISNYIRFSLGAQQEETWFKDVFRLSPAHNLIFQKGVLKKYKYWTYPTTTNYNLSFNKAVDIYKNLFFDSVQIRLRSNVPIGTTLSSGIDSNSIVSVLRKFHDGEHHTFTADFNETKFDNLEKQVYKSNNIQINEGLLVKELTKELQLSSHFIEITNGEFVSELKKIIWHLESGHSSTAVFPHMKIMNYASDYVKVVLEGQGADELLGYQQKHFISTILRSIKQFRFLTAFNIFKKNSKTYSFFYAIKMYLRYKSNDFHIVTKIYENLTSTKNLLTEKLSKFPKINDYPDDSLLRFDCSINRELFRQHTGGLVNLLHYGDSISMANSLESRLPFLDYRLVEFSFSLPWHFKIHEDLTKYIHRQSMTGIVHNKILNNPLKFGFNTPISNFFKKEFNSVVKPLDIILSKQSINRGFYKLDYLHKIIEEHDNGKRNHSTFLFRILSVELWFQTFID